MRLRVASVDRRGSLASARGGEDSAVVAFDENTGQEIWRLQSTPDVGYAPLIMFEKVNPTSQLIF